MRYLNMLVGRLKIEALSTTISPRIICRKSSRCLHFFYGGQLLFLLE